MSSTMTTETTITQAQIKALRREAGLAGDTKMVRACELALEGDAAWRDVCVVAIREAEAMADDSEEVHVTSVRGDDVYGHTTDHCDPSGCSGDEHFFPSLSAGEASPGDVIRMPA